jgi:histidinol phosphatase-like PHP family hydrolase
MQEFLSRRSFLCRTTAAACGASLLPLSASAAEAAKEPGFDFPLVDFHVHLDNSTIGKVAELSRERGIKFGIVEHAGTKENQYPVVLSNDDELAAHLKMLDGQPVFKGIQAEWTDWMDCFSPKVLARLDYVLADAMTFPGTDGRRAKLWDKDAETRVDMRDKQKWMDRFVEWHLDILRRQPIDILANTTWLPAALAADYDLYWTPERMKKVIETAVEHGVALEISSGMKLPKRTFLQAAKAAGAKFSLGSNGRYPNMGRLDYSLEMARALKLTKSDMFTPAPEGRKAVQRWRR